MRKINNAKIKWALRRLEEGVVVDDDEATNLGDGDEEDGDGDEEDGDGDEEDGDGDEEDGDGDEEDGDEEDEDEDEQDEDEEGEVEEDIHLYIRATAIIWLMYYITYII